MQQRLVNFNVVKLYTVGTERSQLCTAHLNVSAPYSSKTFQQRSILDIICCVGNTRLMVEPWWNCDRCRGTLLFFYYHCSDLCTWPFGHCMLLGLGWLIKMLGVTLYLSKTYRVIKIYLFFYFHNLINKNFTIILCTLNETFKI